jgi:addiction module HigA family antidote
VKPRHPGAFLVEEIEKVGLTQAQFSRVTGLSPMRLSLVIRGARPVTPELALYLGRTFGRQARYWLGLQNRFDLHEARAKLRPRLRRMHRIFPHIYRR